MLHLFNGKQDNIHDKKKYAGNCCVMIYANDHILDGCNKSIEVKPYKKLVLKIIFDSEKCTYFVNNLSKDVKVDFEMKAITDILVRYVNNILHNTSSESFEIVTNIGYRAIVNEFNLQNTLSDVFTILEVVRGTPKLSRTV